MDSLDIDLGQDGFQDKLEELKKSIISKLTNGYGYELQDESLSMWIMKMVVEDNKSKAEAEKDLEEFISENSPDFVNWLWEKATLLLKSNTLNVEDAEEKLVPQIDQKPVKNETKTVEKSSEPKKETTENSTSDRLIK